MCWRGSHFGPIFISLLVISCMNGRSFLQDDHFLMRPFRLLMSCCWVTLKAFIKCLSSLKSSHAFHLEKLWNCELSILSRYIISVTIHPSILQPLQVQVMMGVTLSLIIVQQLIQDLLTSSLRRVQSVCERNSFQQVHDLVLWVTTHWLWPWWSQEHALTS